MRSIRISKGTAGKAQKGAESMNTDKAYAERIASEYAPKRDSKVAALKKLDARARRPAEILAYVLGILSALVLGVGMCLSMGVVGPGTGAAWPAWRARG